MKNPNKYIRSTKCSLKFSTALKRGHLGDILSEYGRVCQFFIDHFWEHGAIPKSQLLKPIVDLPLESSFSTWLSARIRKVAAREALDMIQAVRRRWKNKPEKQTKPCHNKRSMRVSSTIADLQKSKSGHEFDAWLHLSSIGKRMILDLPIRKHKHFKDLEQKGTRLNSYVITKNYVQFSFEVSFDTKDEKHAPASPIGVDTGIKKLAVLSDGTFLGTDLETYLDRIKATLDSQNSQKKARRALRHYMDRTAKKIVEKNPAWVAVEDLKDLKKNTKKDKKLNKSVRRTLGAWAYSYWLKRLEMTCERHRVPFKRVSPAYTSQMCNQCKHIDRLNRKGEHFQCRSCDWTSDADLNAALNILNRSREGP